MATFDWLTNPTNSNADPLGYAGPQNGLDASKNAGGATSKFTDTFSDDTFIRTLGEMGAAIGGKGSVGAALGQGASSLVRNRAVQREGEKVANNNQNQTLYDKTIKQLSDGTLMSDPSKNDAFDSILIGGDKSITAKYKHSPEAAGPLKEQQGLDSITNTPETQSNNGGSNLPDFTSSQGSKADFSGLDPADVSMILGAKQSAGTLTQRTIANYLDNKYRNKVLDVRTKTNQARLSLAEKKLSEGKQQAILERKQKVADKKEEKKFKVSMKLFEKELAKAEPGSLEEKKAIADIDNLNSQIKAREEKTKNGGETPAETQRIAIAQKRLDMSMAAVEESKKKDAMEQQKDAIKYEEIILSNMDEEATAPMMDYINQNSNKPYYYTQYNDDGEGLFNLAGDTLGAKLPLITKNGVQMDMAAVRASAEAYNMSVDDFLASPGIGILTKGDNNDYQPANR